ncbi:NAD(P)-binding protein [Lophium mytilinum]|uniref:NAD(P)-binding protein n=1 Tax=Lophium mytilinum TaxID=390894 RepID=A0A6A6R8S4_9PEZI|nr:NAD(P)-binding protein [Lophium mytilinum]
MDTSKVALVTAGSKGLGAAIARVLATEAHMRVVINYHSDSSSADELVQELKHLTRTNTRHDGSLSNAERFIAIKADMAFPDQIKQLVEESIAKMGRLDAVVSNAGWTRMTNFMDLQDADREADWDQCFNMNVKSHFFLFMASHKHLKSSEGAFIATASVAGVKPSGSSLPYAVTKAALVHLTKSLAVIAAPQIRVNCVSPGVLLTDWGRQFSEERLQTVKTINVLKRLAKTEDVAQQVKVLVLSQSVTGVNSVVDAGFSL